MTRVPGKKAKVKTIVWKKRDCYDSAYHILHTIEYRLRLSDDRRSWKTIRDILSTDQRLTVEYNVKEREHRHHADQKKG